MAKKRKIVPVVRVIPSEVDLLKAQLAALRRKMHDASPVRVSVLLEQERELIERIKVVGAKHG